MRVLRKIKKTMQLGVAVWGILIIVLLGGFKAMAFIIGMLVVAFVAGIIIAAHKSKKV